MKNILKSGIWQCLWLAVSYLFLGLFALILFIPKMLWSFCKFVVKSTFGWLIGIIVIALIVGIVLIVVL